MNKFQIGDFVIDHRFEYKLGRVVEVIDCEPFDLLKVMVGPDDYVTRPSVSFEKISNADNFTIIQHVNDDDQTSINDCPARQIAADILSDTVLSTDDYYAVEDYLTDVLNGNECSAPEVDYLLAALMNAVQTVINTSGLEVDDETDFVESVAKSFLPEDKIPLGNEIKERVNLHLAYQIYCAKWNEEHDEGEPACLDDFFMNEYQDEECIDYYGIRHLVPEH